MREKINAAASAGQPWEFDRRRLFGKARYMASVCDDLGEVTSALEQFLRFLSPEVKTIVGKRAAEVDGMLEAVAELKEPFADIDFDGEALASILVRLWGGLCHVLGFGCRLRFEHGECA